jgi:hypothetical protein
MTALHIESPDTTTMSLWGCLVPHDSDDTWTEVVLDFGQPWYDSTDAVYGANGFDNGTTFHSISTIESGVKAFILSYTGTDCGPTAGGVEFLIGVNNETSTLSGSAVNYSHGAAWGAMVADVNSWMSDQGYGWQNDAIGGIDAEAYYGSASATRSWADGFSSVSGVWYGDFGTCDSCPKASQSGCYYDVNTHPTCDISNEPIGGDWTVDDVYYISWTASGGFPLPEIYGSVFADYWEYIDLYGSATTSGDGYWVGGVMTECTAVNQRGGTMYSPTDGWTAMVSSLNNATFYPYSNQSVLDWSDDIGYQDSSYSSSCFTS